LQEVAQTFKNNPVDKVPATLIQKCL
jgi:hypothetical protein